MTTAMKPVDIALALLTLGLGVNLFGGRVVARLRGAT